jgi:hypothetical protein
MSAKKFEKLIDLIINEDQERANQLFHEIVVEKSREIYESIIDEDSIEGLEDEVSADEEGMDDEMDGMDDMDGGDDFGDEDFGDEEGDAEFGDEEDGEFGDEEGDLEDRVVDLEDKLDELMAEFESQLGDDEGDEDFGGDDEMGADDDMDDMGDEGEEDFGGGDDDMGDEGDDEEAGLMEAALKQVGGKTYDKFGKMGDDGQQTKSPGLQNPKRLQTGGNPVKLGGTSESVPTSAKKPSNAYAKGEKTENFGNVNVPGGNAGKTGFKTKAPAPKTETVKAKSPVAEARRTTKRRI